MNPTEKEKIELLRQEVVKVLNIPNLSEEEIKIALQKLLRQEVERFPCNQNNSFR